MMPELMYCHRYPMLKSNLDRGLTPWNRSSCDNTLCLSVFVFNQAKYYKMGVKGKRGNNYKWRVTRAVNRTYVRLGRGIVNYIISWWNGTGAERAYFKPWCILSLLYLDCHLWRKTWYNWESTPICMTGAWSGGQMRGTVEARRASNKIKWTIAFYAAQLQMHSVHTIFRVMASKCHSYYKVQEVS